MPEISNLTVCLLGVGTVFIGLAFIIILCTLMSKLVQMAEHSTAPTPSLPQQSTVPADSSGITPEIGLAIAAVLCKTLHVNPANLQIRSIRKL
jgi:Na+-transporting methylmalonyl-CoA/oxaloacetate decarboxylase gamma subunit